MRGWKQEGMFLAGQECPDRFDFISDLGIRGIICLWLLWLLVLPDLNNWMNHVL